MVVHHFLVEVPVLRVRLIVGEKPKCVWRCFELTGLSEPLQLSTEATSGLRS